MSVLAEVTPISFYSLMLPGDCGDRHIWTYSSTPRSRARRPGASFHISPSSRTSVGALGLQAGSKPAGGASQF